MNKQIKTSTRRLGSKQNGTLKERNITPEDISKFKEEAVTRMVKALTSDEGYKVMKELSKR